MIQLYIYLFFFRFFSIIGHYKTVILVSWAIHSVLITQLLIGKFFKHIEELKMIITTT